MDNYVKTRWTVPFAGFLLAFMGGFSYAWGAFVVPLVSTYGWTTAQSTMPFTVFMVVFALVMFPAGRLQDMIGPRKVSAIGALLFIVAYGLASLVDRFPYPWWLLATYGVIGGIACGMTYACVAPPARKWFPDKPGLAISFAVMGFGLAAVFAAPLKAERLIPAYGIGGTLLIIGTATLVVSLFAAWLIKNPPKGWEPPGWKSNAKNAVKATRDAAPKDLLSSPIFWTSWLTFALVIAGGLMCIPIIPAYGELVVKLTAVEAAGAISVFAGFNGFGRPVAGYLSDRFGTVWVMLVTYIIQAITLFFFSVFAVTLPTLYISAALLGWGFAVTLALFPTLTAYCFGTTHLGVNYGLVFTAFGIGALAPSLGAAIFDATGSYSTAFLIAGVMAGLGFILCLVLKKKYALS